jgi:hypothetical protein
MKEYQANLVRLGENLNYIVVCKSQTRAAELFGTEVSYLRSHGYIIKPRTQIAIDNPEKVYAYADSGLIFNYRRDILRVILPLEELTTIIRKLIDEHGHR